MDDQAVLDAISSKADAVNDAINDGASASTAKSICDALGIEAITTDVFDNLSLQGCSATAMPKRRREWAEDPETIKRMERARSQSRKRVASEPWAAVVLAQVGVEVALAYVVHSLRNGRSPLYVSGSRACALTR